MGDELQDFKISNLDSRLAKVETQIAEMYTFMGDVKRVLKYAKWVVGSVFGLQVVDSDFASKLFEAVVKAASGG